MRLVTQEEVRQCQIQWEGTRKGWEQVPSWQEGKKNPSDSRKKVGKGEDRKLMNYFTPVLNVESKGEYWGEINFYRMEERIISNRCCILQYILAFTGDGS